MSAFNYKELKRHVGHNIECVNYGEGQNDYDDKECNKCPKHPNARCLDVG